MSRVFSMGPRLFRRVFSTRRWPPDVQGPFGDQSRRKNSTRTCQMTRSSSFVVQIDSKGSLQAAMRCRTLEFSRAHGSDHRVLPAIKHNIRQWPSKLIFCLEFFRWGPARFYDFFRPDVGLRTSRDPLGTNLDEKTRPERVR